MDSPTTRASNTQNRDVLRQHAESYEPICVEAHCRQAWRTWSTGMRISSRLHTSDSVSAACMKARYQMTCRPNALLHTSGATHPARGLQCHACTYAEANSAHASGTPNALHGGQRWPPKWPASCKPHKR
eukprot:2202446-Amphidinium_carterae.4